MSELLNCPFCGGAPTFRRHVIEYEADSEYPAGEYDEGFSISCHECGFEIGDEYREDVVGTWNSRTMAVERDPDLVQHRVHFEGEDNSTEWRDGDGSGMYPESPLLRIEVRKLYAGQA